MIRTLENMKNKIMYLLHSRYSNITIAVLFALISLLILTQKTTTGTTDIIYNSNSQITADSGDIIQQTWMASKKEVTGISIPLSSPLAGLGNFSLFLSSSQDFEATVLVSGNASVSEVNALDFSFEEPASLTLGTRYYITLVCDDLQQPIILSASSNSKTCTRNTTPLDCTLSATVIYEKNSSVFLLYAILVMIGSFSLIFMLLFDKSFEQVVCLALISLVLILYLAGLCGHLAYGHVILFILTLLCLLASSVLIRKKRIYFVDLISPGLIIWIAGFLLIVVYNYRMVRTTWDEYSHWGAVVRDMFFFDSLSNHAGTTVIHSAYPPFISLVQYLFVSINGVFTENYLYIAMQVTFLSCLIVVFKNITWTKWKYLIPGCVILLFTPMIIFSDVYSSLYVDALLGIMMAYLLICYFSDGLSHFNILRLSFGMVALCLTKDMGAVMAGLTFLLIFFHTIFKNRKIFAKQTALCLIFFVCILTFFISWQFFSSIDFNPTTASIQANAVTRSNISLSGLFDFISGNGSDGQYYALQSFINSFFNSSEYNYALGPLYLPFFPFLVFILLIIWILYSAKHHTNIRILFEIMFLATMGSFFYGGFLLLAYLFAFPYNEMLILSSYYRYMGSYLSAILISTILILFMHFAEEDDFYPLFTGGKCLALTVAILFIITPFTILVNRPIYTRNLDHLYEYDEIVSLAGSFTQKTEKVHFICSSTDGFFFFLFADAVVPMRTGTPPGYTVDSSGEYSANTWGNILSGENYDYVYIRDADSDFISSCAHLFEGGSDGIQNNTFYKVNTTDNGSILLTIIAAR